MSKVDLSALRMAQHPSGKARRPLGPRLLTGAFVALGLGVIATFVWPLLRPVRVVPMAQVRAGESVANSGASAAEAVGWVEADPYATFVRPLVMGRIERLHVLEGAAVVAGETLLAELSSAEVFANIDRATAMTIQRSSEVDAAKTALATAAANLQQNAMARREAAEASVMRRDSDAQLARAQNMVPKNAAMLAAAEAMASAQRRLRDSGASNAVALQRAEADEAAARADLALATAELKAMEQANRAAIARDELAQELAAAPVELQFAVTTAENALATAQTMLATAKAELVVAERELSWTRVIAPATGLVMRLTGAPGMEAGPSSEPILAIYEPSKLRARIDVPLGSIGAVREGQAVELRSESLGNLVVRGVVQRIQHESDLLKNTLQVKVGIENPPALLRPETLVRANFLAEKKSSDTSGPTSLRVPSAAVQGESVFVFDPVTRSAREIAVKVVGEAGGDKLVLGELSVAQRVVLVPVLAGETIAEKQP